MLLFAVRHAESLANIDKSAGLNAALSPLGERQTLALIDRFTARPLRAVYSSPFLRCIQTARPIAERLGLTVRIRPDLAEFHHLPKGASADTGLPPIEALVRQHSGLSPCPDWAEPFVWPDVDESLDQLVRRMQRMESYLKSRWTDDNDAVLIISHGSPIARLVDAWLTNQAGPSFRFIIDNAALTALRYHAGISSLVCLNETSQLVGLPAPVASNFDGDGLPKAVPPSAYW